MSGNLQVSMLLKAVDQASSVLKQVSQNANALAERAARFSKDGQNQTQRAYRETAQVFNRGVADQSRSASTLAERAARSAKDGQTQTQRAYRETAQVFNRGVSDQARQSERAAQSREQASVRAENAIQREITQTEAAYRRVSRAATSSATAQQRAFAGVSTQARRTTTDLQAMKRQQEQIVRQTRQSTGGGGMGNTAMAVGGGVIAGGYAASRPIGETMSYDRRLAMMSNTAYSDKNLAGRQAGMKELDTAIVHSVRTGGGTREDAAETLDGLLASGAISQKSAMNLLPTLQKFSTATGADPKALGDIAIRGMQTFGIKESELPKALDMAIMAGQKGGFELKDMAKWLPQQMAAGKQAGLSGMGGFAKLLAANQASVITAGSKDEAGNNLVNLLAKINSNDTKADLKKLHIDLPGTLAKARSEGTDGLDAFVGIVDHVVGKDKRFAELKKQAASAPTKSVEKQDAMNGMADILQGSAIGKVIQDRQALMALVALMNNRDYVKGIEKQLPNAAGTGEANFQTIAATDDFKVKQAANENAIAKQKALGGVNGVVGDGADWWTRFARDNPLFATATSGSIETGKVAASAGGVTGTLLLLQRFLGASGKVAATEAAPSVFSRVAAAAAPAVGPFAAGVAPLGVMAGVTAWAQKEDKSTETNFLVGLSKWLDGFIGKQAEFDSRREAQLQSLLTTPIKVVVEVKDGNIVAQMNQWQVIKEKRF
ncbi:phage tail tape measure protein [uncultured Deefgea sp.]|uniref:phage tail tape measure protein n=1 Tax=uncultured Deefgea sp. TaxID=1304914 RepID=UPI00262D3AD2|nr:phage tail tape measure protein [uncultured Deefgea sp.]